MAKRTTQGSRGRKTTSRRSTAASKASSKSFDLKNINKTEIKRALRKVGNNPLALYLAGGVGALFLGRFAYRYYKNHPEIQEFIKENFDTVESSLREYRNGAEEVETTDARH